LGRQAAKSPSENHWKQRISGEEQDEEDKKKKGEFNLLGKE